MTSRRAGQKNRGRRAARARQQMRAMAAPDAEERSAMPTPPCTPPEATSERLAMALAATDGVPPSMIAAARAGHYDDYKSGLAAPIIQLVADLARLDTPQATALAHRAQQGEFNATREEAQAWAQTPDGRAALRAVLGEEPR